MSNVHNISVGNGKGITTYFKSNIFTPVDDYVTAKMQISKFSSIDLDVISVYRSDRGNPNEMIGKLLSMIEEGKTTIITGDFNICYRDSQNHRFIRGMHELRLNQLVQEATHIQGRLIDHVYWIDPLNQWQPPELERYSPYYSDHDALLVTLKPKVSYSLLCKPDLSCFI